MYRYDLTSLFSLFINYQLPTCIFAQEEIISEDNLDPMTIMIVTLPKRQIRNLPLVKKKKKKILYQGQTQNYLILGLIYKKGKMNVSVYKKSKKKSHVK